MSASGPPVDMPNLDESVVRLPDDIRRDVAEAAASNLYGFVRGVLGYRDVTPTCHGPLCEWHDRNPSQHKLTLMPRGHLKTSVITIGKTLQRVVKDPERRILLANETATNAERFLSSIKGHAETNRVFRALYSHVIPGDTRLTRWSQQELVFSRQGSWPEPTIDTIGMTGAMTSRHYTDLEIDDPISEEAAKSQLVMNDVISRLSKLKSLMVDPGRDTFDLTGTRWSLFDVYSDMEAKLGSRLARFIRAAIENGQPIWPERFSLEVLAEIRTTLNDEYMWSCLYMNSPRDAGVQDFNVQDLRFWRWSDDEERIVLYEPNGQVRRELRMDELDVTVTVDVRYGETLDSDRDAVVTVGTTQDGDAVFLDAWGKRATPLEVVAKVLQVTKRFKPRCVGIQKVGYEMSLKWHLKAESEREGVYVHVVPVRPGGPGKTHIRGLQPVAATGHMYVSPTQHMLRQELAEYPLGKNDDVADAAALQLQLWRGVLSQDRMKRLKEAEDRIIRGINLQRQLPQAAALARPDDRGHLPTADDVGWDPEDHRYGQFVDVVMN